MGFPAGMQLATVAFGIPLTATGKDVVTKVTVKPTSRVIWAATGQPLPEFSDSFTAEAGLLGQFQVPFVDQSGFIDSAGNAVTDFAYQISASWEFGNERPINWSKNLKPLLGQTGPIDLDLVPDGPVSIPVTAPTAAVLGFGGRTGFVTLQESDLPPRLSASELSATYAPASGSTSYAAKTVETSKLDKTEAATLYAPDGGVRPVGKGELVTNVKDYGAKGDGTTNDTAALNAALAASDNVFFPKGVYRIDNPVQRSGGKITITGAPGAVIKPLATYAQGDGRDMLRVLDPTGPVVIQGLTIDGNATALNGGAGFPNWQNYIGTITVLGTVISALVSVTIRNNRIYNAPSTGINVTGGTYVTVEDNWVDDVMHHPIYVGRSTLVPTTFVRIARNRVAGRGDQGTDPLIGGIGILVQKCNRVHILDNQISNTSDTGTKTEGCNDVLYRGNHVVDAGKDGIKVQAYQSDVTQVYRAVITGNIVQRINAWRTDGTGLIVMHNVKQAVIADNVVEGGGTRVADAYRCVCESTGFPFSDLLIANNLATNIAGLGVRVIESANTNQNANVTISGNRVGGGILAGSKGGGDYKIIGNTIDKAGVLNTTVYGVNVDKFVTGSVDVSGNTIADHLGGVFVTLSAASDVRAVRIADNIIRDVKDWGARVDNFDASQATAQVVEIVRNQFINTSADGAAKTAAIRIGIAQLSVVLAKVSQNIFRQIGAGTIGAPLQINGTTYPVSLMDYSGNMLSGSITSPDVNGETAITRLTGYSRSAAPTWGTWAVGDYVTNKAPAETGTAGSKYVVKGWVCVTAGSPGTWVQDRALTGN
ncbi:right-handed parallel beta-helix repeat-containing protein [Arthrobacter sp. ISL-72]|uniref:right-handed parallel beta-helix repeat-containing protein n=1 Tax=Arthrobacter sp. ISL-72 TaxID=2819114 RepID=UPI001BEC7A2F|nr:right-handed parallel beta-helix repeat-containing protein [Arthrobacter sp. ISL-72]MBT2594720.1 right-handed parallel beta-helix repeat-containing protein [Arthrobacter sp. ISL-72]